MATQVAYSADISSYPSHSQDPYQKGFDFILQYSKAAYTDSNGYMIEGSLNIGNYKFSEIKMYGLGKQPIDKYRRIKSPGTPQDESWASVDWTPPAFICKFREIGIAKVLQREFDIQCSVVDPLARSQEDELFNQMKIKVMARQAVIESGGDPDQYPQLQSQPGEPQDLEQLEMMRDFGYKHIMAVEGENAVNLIHSQNNFDEIRKQCVIDSYDYGIGAMTQWIDENGMVKERRINPEYLGLSYCEKSDFSDLIHWFEIIPTYVADLAPYYTKEQLDDICKKVVGKNGNPTQYIPFSGVYNRAWMRFKVMVMHIKFLSWNETVYKEEFDGKNNMRFGATKYSNKQFISINNYGKLEENKEQIADESDYYTPIDDTGAVGQKKPKFTNSVKKDVYKASWLVGTDYMHNYGLQENQNRKLSSWWDTNLDIQIYAPNFYKMQFSGITERLIPLEDKACMAWYNLQNLSNNLIPYLINLDLTAVESIPLGKGGANMKPNEVIDFIFNKFVVPWRSTDPIQRTPGYKPVSIEATGQLAAFGMLYDELQHTIEMMRQVSGLNELTDGSTPNAKTLVPVANAAISSTNNALYLISEADKYLIEKSADAIIQKVQIAVGMGKVEGYAKSLGSTAVKFLQINPDIALHELGIRCIDTPTQEQKQQLWQELTIGEAKGVYDISDKIYLMKAINLDEAAMYLGYKSRKAKEKMHQEQIELMQQQTQGNIDIAAATKEMEQQSISTQAEADMELLIAEKMWDFEIEKMKKTADLSGEQYQSDSRTLAQQIAAEAKIIAASISAKSQERKASLQKKAKK